MALIFRCIAWCVAVATPLIGRAQSQPDSLERLRDSLEVRLLKTTRTYQQVERLLASVPPRSTYLNLVPSVLPVDLPVDAFRVSSPFGIRRHPIHQQIRFHGGVDVKARIGMVVKATAPGVIQQVGYDPALGFFVRITHPFGFETVYGHLSAYCVKPGQPITRNQEVGRVGQTGLATGPHLHYGIKKNGSVVDPFNFCFLLRRRVWLVQTTRPIGSSDSTVASSISLPSRE